MLCLHSISCMTHIDARDQLFVSSRCGYGTVLDADVRARVHQLCLRRRGCRAGEHVRRRRRPAVREARCHRARVLVDVQRTTPPEPSSTTNQLLGQSSGRCRTDRFPTLYVLNLTSLAKPLAVQHLHTDLIAYDRHSRDN